MSSYLFNYARPPAAPGEFRHLMKVIDKLYEIGETFDYTEATQCAGGLKVGFFIKARKAHEALSEAEDKVSYSREKGTELQELISMANKAESQQLVGDIEGAHDSILKASEIYKKQTSTVVRLFVAPYIATRFFLYVEQLKHAIRSESSSEVVNLRKPTYEAGKAAVRNSTKYAPYRTKVLRLMGLYSWIIGKQGNALKWWGRTIEEGERLGARPDLSRTYFEVGKRLLEPQSKYEELNGIEAKGYLDKAEILFEEMGLERDIDDLDRLKADYGL